MTSRTFIAPLISWLGLGLACRFCATEGAAADPPTKAPQREHFAFCNLFEYLDGSKLEAMSGKSPNLAWDERGNIYFFATFWYGAIRCCIWTDGRIVTITGNDYWTPHLNLREGPASAFPPPTGGSWINYSYPGGIAVRVYRMRARTKVAFTL